MLSKYDLKNLEEKVKTKKKKGLGAENKKYLKCC